MLLVKNIEVEHNEENPWADDALNREPIAQKLTKILNTVTQPFVVSLDSPFGTGKTFFIKRWAQQLKNEGANVVYFNAWETDYAQDPFMAFLATLDDSFFKGSPIAKDAENAKKAGKALLKSMAFNILETATVGIVKAGDWKEAEAAAETLQLKRYDEYKSTQETINKFKETLLDYGQKLREKDEQKRPTIIFVDELDRCRPNYAIELLEVIKHLFNIENYVFVLGIDRKQLISSIGAVYGATVDGEAYLKKFVEWNYALPQPSTENFVQFLYEKFSLKDVMKQGDDFARGGNDLVKSLYQLSSLFGLSLRDIERYMTQLNLLIRYFGENQGIFPMLFTLLLIVKDKKPNLYEKYCLESEHDDKMLEYLKSLPKSKEFFDIRYGEWLSVWITVAAVDNDGAIAARIQKISDKINNTERRNIAYEKEMERMNEAREIFKHFSFRFHLRRHLGQYLHEHIEDMARS